jgi:apolipoprotein N-acyltransferase
LPAVATGLLSAAAFPRLHQGWLGWVAWVPLLVFVARSQSRRLAFAGGWLAGVVEFFILLRWMPEVMGRHGGMPPLLSWVAYTLLIAILACYTAAACLFVRHLIFRRDDRMLLLFPFVWVVVEFLESVSPIEGLPWLLAGYTQTRFPAVLQIADLAGVYGVSFLVIAVNTALAWLWLRKGRGRAAFAPLVLAGVLFIGALLYGWWALERWDGSDAPFHAALLQGNISVEDSWDVMNDKFEQGYVRMADKLAGDSKEQKERIDVMVLPESPTPRYFQTDADYRRAMEALARRYPMGLVLGNVNLRERPDGTEAHYNSAFFLDGGGRLTGVYDKIHLVPFGEYIPYKRLFFFAETVSKEMGGFDAGKDVKVLRLGGHPANAVICFEAAFPDLVRRFVNQGSQVIVNLTNDGWYGVSDAPYQHLEIARVRAVENRRYFLRAANSGVSTVIEPTGRFQMATGLMQEAICRGDFAFIEEKTLYTRYGNVFIWLCVIICAVAGFWSLKVKGTSKIRERDR